MTTQYIARSVSWRKTECEREQIVANRKGEYFHAAKPANNADGPQWTNLAIGATGQTAVSGHALVPRCSETFTHEQSHQRRPLDQQRREPVIVAESRESLPGRGQAAGHLDLLAENGS
jgi:hypothetical protein